MKNTILIFCFLMISKMMNAQINLVPNPSFEDTIRCPSSFDNVTDAKYWYSPTLSSPNYFNACYNATLDSFGLGVPYNGFGYEYAKSGNAYAGWGVRYDTIIFNYREYLQVKLLSTLKAGKKYFISAFFARASNIPMVLKNFGIAISDSAIGGGYATPINYTPQIIYTQFLTDTNWVEISDTIISNGGEQYLTMGYFNYNNASDTMSLFYNSFNDQISYYYVDDVNVNCLDCGVGIHDVLFSDVVKISSLSNGTFSIYSGNVSIDYIQINNLLGQIVLFKKSINGNPILFDLNIQPQGIYFLKIKIEDKFFTQKLFINH